MYQKLACSCQINISWPFPVATCKHGNQLQKPPLPKEQKGSGEDALL